MPFRRPRAIQGTPTRFYAPAAPARGPRRPQRPSRTSHCGANAGAPAPVLTGEPRPTRPQSCLPESKPLARADAGRRSDAPARSKEPRRASTRRLRPREVRAGRNGRHGPRTAGANAGAPASPFSRASRGRLAPPSSGGSSASVPAAAAGRERRKERREVKGVSSGPDRCACTPASASPTARASALSCATCGLSSHHARRRVRSTHHLEETLSTYPLQPLRLWRRRGGPPHFAGPGAAPQASIVLAAAAP
jgi:hypothetical protein